MPTIWEAEYLLSSVLSVGDTWDIPGQWLRPLPGPFNSKEAKEALPPHPTQAGDWMLADHSAPFLTPCRTFSRRVSEVLQEDVPQSLQGATPRRTVCASLLSREARAPLASHSAKTAPQPLLTYCPTQFSICPGIFCF
jgi:hypothetical protein